jgi:hypothetical protein
MRKVLNGENANLHRLGAVEVEYTPGDMRTTAVKVTRENIGALALEAQAELGWGNNIKHMCITALVERTNDNGEKIIAQKSFFVDEWIIVVMNELHSMPDDVFWNTFSRVGDPAHEMQEAAFQSLSDAGIAESLTGVNPLLRGGTTFMELPKGYTHQGEALDQPSQQ